MLGLSIYMEIFEEVPSNFDTRVIQPVIEVNAHIILLFFNAVERYQVTLYGKISNVRLRTYIKLFSVVFLTAYCNDIYNE